MNQFFIGDVLRQRREELGLTQEALAYGIFGDPSAISRIENGKQSITYRKLLALFEKLNLPKERYYALVDKNELEILELQTQIAFCIIHNDSTEGLCKVAVLQRVASSDDILSQQFILKSKSALGAWKDGHIVQYQFSEKVEMLSNAIHLTVPDFDITAIGNHLYCIEDIKIINQIALAYSDAGYSDIALKIYRQLVEYIKVHLYKSRESTAITILVTYNYSRELYFQHLLKDAISIAEWGLQLSKSSRISTYLGGFLYVLAYCTYESGEINKSYDYLLRSYYAYLTLEDSPNIILAQNALQELFGKNISYQISIPPEGKPSSCGSIPLSGS